MQEYNHDRRLISFKDCIDRIRYYNNDLIGVSDIYDNDIFIFKTTEEAAAAKNNFSEHPGFINASWYSKEEFLILKKSFEESENKIVKVYWI